MRLDVYLASRYQISRNQAQTLIEMGYVLVDGNIAQKTADGINDATHVSLETTEIFVGRGAYKLLGFFENHPTITPTRVLDVGSSTGGFTQILLKKGAQQVVCVDVGRTQLHSSLRNDPRVCVFEKTDIRDFQSAPFPLITCDVSFVSLKHILPSIARLCEGEAIVLFKPQYEVGKDAKRNKKGLVLDEASIKQALESICAQCQALGFTLRSVELSKLGGSEGNAESFLYLSR